MQRKRGAGNIPAPQVNLRQLSLDKTDRLAKDTKKRQLYPRVRGTLQRQGVSGGEEPACRQAAPKGNAKALRQKDRAMTIL